MPAKNLYQQFKAMVKQRSLRQAGLISMALLIAGILVSSCATSSESIASAPSASEPELEQQVLDIIKSNPDVISKQSKLLINSGVRTRNKPSRKNWSKLKTIPKQRSAMLQ
jgi:hypothetical protein